MRNWKWILTALVGGAIGLAGCQSAATQPAAATATLAPVGVSTLSAATDEAPAAPAATATEMPAATGEAATQAPPATETQAPASEPTAVRYLDLDQGVTAEGFYTLGRADAPVTVIDYHDFLCPNCQRYATTVEPQVIEQYVRSGQARLVFRDVLNHGERSERASEGAACAGQQGYFWHMRELLFARQGTLFATAPADMAALMISYAGEIEGLAAEPFAACVNERQTLAALQATDAEQRTRGITSQPVFEIGAQRLWGVQSLEAMGAVIEAAGN